MGNVKVSYANGLLEITGKAGETLDLPTPLSLRDFICHLVERYGKAFEKELHLKTFEWGQESFLYQFYVNGHKIPAPMKEDLLIHHQSEVAILPILGGG
jgi:molybdopterin converting factor small subunit